ncbi:MAG: hypothetical protein ACOCRX_05115 [Candidatus Woesearchaeota archaeon]
MYLRTYGCSLNIYSILRERFGIDEGTLEAIIFFKNILALQKLQEIKAKEIIKKVLLVKFLFLTARTGHKE